MHVDCAGHHAPIGQRILSLLKTPPRGSLLVCPSPKELGSLTGETFWPWQ